MQSIGVFYISRGGGARDEPAPAATRRGSATAQIRIALTDTRQGPRFPPEGALTPRTVLLADDDDALRRLLVATLSNQELEIIQAADGEEALQLARRHRPAVVVLDVTMPRRNGFEVCELLKSDPSTADTKVVILTGSHSDTHRVHGVQAGTDRYLTKPFSPLQLLETIYSLLEPAG